MKTKEAKEKNKDLNFYMSLNYPFTVELYEENGGINYGLQIPDLTGVWASGKTLEEAYSNLVDTKKLWFKTCLEKKLDIPDPTSEKDYSGKFILRLEAQLHMKLSQQAKRKKISLNKHIKSLLEKQILNSDLSSEIKGMKKAVTSQIENLRQDLISIRQRIDSLEHTFSEISSDISKEPTMFLRAGPPDTLEAWPQVQQFVVTDKEEWKSSIPNIAQGSLVACIPEQNKED